MEASSKLTGNHLKRKVVVALLTWKYFFEISIFSCELLKPGFPKCPSGTCGTPGYMCRCGLQDLWLPGAAGALKAPIRSIISPLYFRTDELHSLSKASTPDGCRFRTEFVSMSWWLKQTQYYFLNFLIDIFKYMWEEQHNKLPYTHQPSLNNYQQFASLVHPSPYYIFWNILKKSCCFAHKYFIAHL